MQGLEYLQSLELWDFKSSFSQNNISIVLDYLGNPQDKPKSIHVAGTNGKGSVCAMMSSILKQAGYSVGTNISPHLVKVNERLIINGEVIDDIALSESLMSIKRAVEATGAPLSYHEALTAAAFYTFRDLDWIVMEVGLGGRLDASNVILSPQIAFITSIGLDHQDILGATLEAIAKEKAGIIKKGIKVIVGYVDPAPYEVILNQASKKGATIFAYGEHFSKEEASVIPVYTKVNESLVRQAAGLLDIDSIVIERGLKKCNWPGRLEYIVFRNKKFLLDCAHNPQGIDSLVAYLNDKEYKNLNIIFSALSNKDWRYLVDQLSPHIVNWNIVKADSSIAETGENILSYLSCNEISSHHDFVNDYDAAIRASMESNSEPVLVCGSIYMLGKIRNKIVGDIKTYW